MVGVCPDVAMVGAVGEGVGVSYGALAASDVSVDGGEGVAYLGVAVVGHGRNMRRRGDGVGQTADGVETVLGGDYKVFWHNVVGVGPGVVGAVDIIGIDEGGVAASVAQRAGVGAGVQVDALSAVGDDGQGGGVYLGEAVDGGVRIGGG